MIVEVFILKIGWVGELLPNFSGIKRHHRRTFSFFLFFRLSSRFYVCKDQIITFFFAIRLVYTITEFFLPTGLYTHPSDDHFHNTVVSFYIVSSSPLVLLLFYLASSNRISCLLYDATLFSFSHFLMHDTPAFPSMIFTLHELFV